MIFLVLFFPSVVQGADIANTPAFSSVRFMDAPHFTQPKDNELYRDLGYIAKHNWLGDLGIFKDWPVHLDTRGITANINYFHGGFYNDEQWRNFLKESPDAYPNKLHFDALSKGRMEIHISITIPFVNVNLKKFFPF